MAVKEVHEALGGEGKKVLALVVLDRLRWMGKHVNRRHAEFYFHSLFIKQIMLEGVSSMDVIGR